ncbi:hypothetical protein PR002_g17527, partial [Phytophthora rubi]
MTELPFTAAFELIWSSALPAAPSSPALSSSAGCSPELQHAPSNGEEAVPLPLPSSPPNPPPTHTPPPPPCTRPSSPPHPYLLSTAHP